jgi:3-(3-hydroxy-phenyl)propionate hydroxylase
MTASRLTGCEIVIAGAGPVGLVTALLLAEGGADVIVLEATGPAVQPEWRGSTLHPPTLEILAEIELADAAVRGGIAVEHLVYGDLEINRLISFDYALLEELTAFPIRVQYEQYKLLQLLRERAVAHPSIDVRWHREVIRCTNATDYVEVVVGDDRERLRAKLLVAADGSHSAVRRSLNIDMPGTTYPTLSLVAATDFDVTVGRCAGPVAYMSGPLGRASFIRTPDVWRIAVTTEIPAGDAPQLVASLETTLDTTLDVHPNLATALDLYTGGSDWADVGFRQYQMYRSHQRVADRFADGRVVLVGDAAHLASTTGGMGLNSGVHDAYDLVTRLATAPSLEQATAEYADVRRAMSLDVVQRATSAARAEGDERRIDERQARLNRLAVLAADAAAAREYLVGAAMLSAVPIRPGRYRART